MHYNWHRFYDPDTGRYVSADHIGILPFEPEDGVNPLYLYASNNPITHFDLTGEFDWYKFIACFAGLTVAEVRALKGGIPDEMLNDPRIADEVSKEIGQLKTKYGVVWKKVRNKLIKKARKRAIERALKRMGRKAFVKWLGGQVAGKFIPLYGQLSLVWDACKASYCAAKAW